jgi:hypothetical protein
MIRYDLDRMGWYDFEAAIEVLLKTKLGMGVESWGSPRGDWGRDAYFKGTLLYPTNAPVTGQFVFQCKFVQGANAAGAKPSEALMNAVRAECTRLKRRAKGISHYALITNVSLSPELRAKVSRAFSKALPAAQIHLHGASDVCDWFDATPTVARAFPQIFGLRRLHELLRSWSRPDLIKRSKLLLDHAEEEAATFVPTRAYREALDTVRKRSLVVLEGPPEMGKTTIGRLLALAVIASDGMEALECRRPRDLFDVHDDERSQVFVVDDCFGRSSYDPALGLEWEREIGCALRLLDSRHWLILTSRAHLLTFAMAELDLERRATERFAASRVLVDASSLSEIEKAQLLYRHAKVAKLPVSRTEELRTFAQAIIRDDKFTPERIRLLIARTADDPRPLEDLAKECLRSPTDSMRKSFRALRAEHRWLLFAMIEQSGWRSIDSLREAYERLCPDDVRRPFDELITQLDNAFIKKRSTGLSIDPIHPTIIDMVAEELATDVQSRRRYLERCQGDGLTVALMVHGGGRGTAVAPLLAGDSEWALLERRALEDLRSGRAHALELLRLMTRQQEQPVLRSRAAETAVRIGRAAVDELNAGDLWTTDSVLMFARAMRGACVPLIDGVWKRQLAAVQAQLARPRPLYDSYSRLRELSQLAELVTYSGWATVKDRECLYFGICLALAWIHEREDWSEELEDWGSWEDDEWDSAEHDFESLEEIVRDLRDCLSRSGPSAPKLLERIAETMPRAEMMRTVCQTLRWEAESKREDVEAAPAALKPSERVVDIESVFNDL